MHIIKMCFTTHADMVNPLSDVLLSNGALAIAQQDASDEPLFQLAPGNTPLWQSTEVQAFFPKTTTTEQLLLTLSQCQSMTDDIENFVVKEVPDEDWVRLTQQQFQPMQFAQSLWIAPAWSETTEFEGTVVKIDPGLAFGTGTHPTTAMCLEWLAKHPPAHQSVIDYGCGSGILAIAALALGAAEVTAIDHDEQALISTRHNASLNPGLALDTLTIQTSDKTPSHPANVVIANILSQPLISLAPTLAALTEPSGTLILSGILLEEIDTVVNAYKHCFSVIDQKSLDGWACVSLLKNEAPLS